MFGRSLIAGAVALAVLSGCEGGGPPQERPPRVQVVAVWTGTEQTRFMAVLDEFTNRAGIVVDYAAPRKSTQFRALLGQRLKEGNEPEVAILPQPGLFARLADNQCRALVALDHVEDEVTANYSPLWRKLGVVDGTLYGVVFKAANKSIVWYEREGFQEAAVSLPTAWEPPPRWEDFVDAARGIARKYGPSVAIGSGGEYAWVLTDWFENVYLRIAGAEKYQKLARGEIRWSDDPAVKKTLRILRRFWNALGLTTSRRMALPDAVRSVFPAADDGSRVASIIYEGDFVKSWIPPSRDADFFEFPYMTDTKSSVVVGSDMAVMMKDTPEARSLMAFLVSPDSGNVWQVAGGFVSPNMGLDLDDYPDQLSRRSAQALLDASPPVFDLSDQQAPEFGSDPERGIQEALLNMFRGNTNPEQTANRIDLAARDSVDPPCLGQE